MFHRSRPSASGRLAAAVLLLASTALLFTPALPALADQMCTHWPKTAAELVSVLESPPEGAVICLQEGLKHILEEPYAGTRHALPPITSTVTIRGQGEGSTIRRSSTATSPFGLFTVTGNGHLNLSAITLRNGLAHRTTPGGGAVLVESGSLTVDTSTFAENSTTCPPDTGGSISGETFSGCTGAQQGGAIYFNGGSATVSMSTFSNNSATDNGGALFVNNADVTIDTSTFSNNSAPNDGTVIYANNNSGSFTIEASTFSNDSDSNNGHAMICGYFSSSPNFTSSIFESSDGSVCCGNINNVTINNSLFSDNSCGNSSSTSPSDIKLDELANNGGPTYTMALQKGSPAIGQVQCDDGARDQRGIQRKSDCDIGAFERTCQMCSCLNKVCTIYVWIDFESDEKGYHKVKNEDGCQVDVIPNDTTKVQWKIMPVNGVIGPNAAKITVKDIIYTTERQKSLNASSLQEPPGGTEPSPPKPENPQKDAKKYPILKPCYFKNSTKLKVTNSTTGANGWVVYSYSNLSKDDGRPNGCAQYNQWPRNSKLDCNCAPPDGDWWWYGIDWSGPVDNGLWDPRMRPETTEDP